MDQAQKQGSACPRPRVYGPEILEPLQIMWPTLNGPAGKRLAPFMAEIVEALERSGELELAPEIRDKLVGISAATIDRLLTPERRRLRVKGRSGTKPGSILKRQIPIRTFTEWDEARPGFCEVDLVAHDGGDPSEDFCQTLDLTCVATGWTECRAVKNKAQRWCFEAMLDVEASLPFPLLGLDSDNGSEFINDQLECLNELYATLRLYVNFFQPQMKLVSKTRRGAKVTKRFDQARTPCQRVLASPHVSEKAKAALTRTYLGLNPAELKRRIAACQAKLLEINRTKPDRRPDRRKEVRRPRPPSVGEKFSWAEISRTSLVRQPVEALRTSWHEATRGPFVRFPVRRRRVLALPVPLEARTYPPDLGRTRRKSRLSDQGISLEPRWEEERGSRIGRSPSGYAASICTNALGGCRPLRPVRPWGHGERSWSPDVMLQSRPLAPGGRR